MLEFVCAIIPVKTGIQVFSSACRRCLFLACLPGVARLLVTFFCFCKKKVTKEKQPEVRRPRKSAGVPCAAHE